MGTEQGGRRVEIQGPSVVLRGTPLLGTRGGWGRVGIDAETAGESRNKGEDTQDGGAKQMFSVPDDIGEMTAAECSLPMSREFLRTRARRARRDFDARVGALLKEKTVRQPSMTALWIIGRVSEESEEWM